MARNKEMQPKTRLKDVELKAFADNDCQAVGMGRNQLRGLGMKEEGLYKPELNS